MEHPLLNVIQQKEELITNFTGYNHTLTATEGSYFDMKNMTSDYYPAMSPRRRRKIDMVFDDDIQGICSGDKFVYITRNKLYVDGVEKVGATYPSLTYAMLRMGSKVIMLSHNDHETEAYLRSFNISDNVHENAHVNINGTGNVDFAYARADGSLITINATDPPADGQYKVETVNDKQCVYQYSSTTGTWNAITDIYLCVKLISASEFKEGDGIRLTFIKADLTQYEIDNIFINDGENIGTSETRCGDFTILKKPAANKLVLNVYPDTMRTINTKYVAERRVPLIRYIIECNNRLWGCSVDGHEIYASKLGDPNNWNVFQGISTDSWAATIGSNGEFTGAVNYRGTPIFFKADSMVIVNISPTGAHSFKEIKCKGVDYYASYSVAVVNDILYYKSRDCVCAYDGSYPVEISHNLGELVVRRATGGSVNNKYYLGVTYYDNTEDLFVYDTKYGIWEKEDNESFQFGIIQFGLVSMFLRDKTLYQIAPTSYSFQATIEPDIDWMVESNDIGYLYTGKAHRTRINAKKYIQKMIMQVSLAIGSHLSVYINYDSSDQWEFLYNFSGTTTSLCKLPIRPHRCNHFRYKIVGHGDAKIYSITKYYVEGSDV